MPSSSSKDNNQHQVTTTTNDNHDDDEIIQQNEDIINEDIIRIPPKSPKHKQHSLLLIVWGLLANIMFCIGTISFVGFTILEFHGRERSIKANIYYGVAFSSFFLNGTLELLIDICLSRTFRHGRYTSKQPYNILISMLFIIGSILDTWAFFLWNRREFVKEHRVQYSSSHTFLLAMIIVFSIEGFGGCFGFGCFEKQKDTRSIMFVDGLDGVANMLFMLGVIIDCVVRYLDEPTEPRATDTVAYLELISAILFIPTSLIYILADLIRFVDYGKHKNKEQDNKDGNSKNSKSNSNNVSKDDVELGNGGGGGVVSNNEKKQTRPPRRDEDDPTAAAAAAAAANPTGTTTSTRKIQQPKSSSENGGGTSKKKKTKKKNPNNRREVGGDRSRSPPPATSSRSKQQEQKPKRQQQEQLQLESSVSHKRHPQPNQS